MVVGRVGVAHLEVMLMIRRRLAIPFFVLTLTLVSTMALRAGAPAEPAAAPPADAGRIARGEYLVTIGGCNDCHTPWKVGERGPEPDLSRMLSGHPAALQMPAAPALPPGPWVASVAGTMTAWSGPWGVSFTANLTPDKETGLGDWTFERFVQTLRTGRHQGKGRPILPPMPYFNYAKATDEDLAAIFAYLQSIPAVHNRVPQPIDPPEAQ
jgi:mono/diheme cytochrome c family protein